MEARFFDTVYHVESPEGIVLELHPAGPYVRLLAWLIDMAIRFGVLIVMAIVIAVLGDPGLGLFYIGFFLIYWLYPVFFELFANGATPGKKAFGLRVVKQNGTPVDLGASLIRNLLRVVDGLPVLFPVGLVAMLITRGFRRIGDLAAGTIVVYGSGATMPNVWRAAAPKPRHPVIPTITMNFSEQQALVSFADRAVFLGESRARELASIVAPHIDSRPLASTDPVSALSDLAAWIRGEKK